MPTVREAVVCLLRELGMTTVFGNPGSTELPMFRDFPDDFRYVLGLQEVRRRRHGRWLRASDAQRGARQPALGGRRRSRDGQHLHRLQESHAARHHRRAAGALDPSLRAVPVRDAGHGAARSRTSSGATSPRAARTCPAAIARAYHIAMQPPCGPTFVSIPVDDWDRPSEPVAHTHGEPRVVSGSGADRQHRGSGSIAARGRRSSSVRRRSRTMRGTRSSRSPSGIRRSCG